MMIDEELAAHYLARRLSGLPAERLPVTMRDVMDYLSVHTLQRTSLDQTSEALRTLGTGLIDDVERWLLNGGGQ